MTAEAQIAEAIKLGLSLAVLWIFLFRLVRDYRSDALRQKLFIVRDHLFDAADAGVIPFDHPAYGMLRKSINGFIRFSHRLNFTTLITAALTYGLYLKPQEHQDFRRRLSEACMTLPTQEAKDRIEKTYRETVSAVFTHITIGSPILWLPLVVMWFLSQRTNRRADIAIRAPGMRVIEDEAQAIGSRAWATEEPKSAVMTIR